jgi:hypothetical protein
MSPDIESIPLLQIVELPFRLTVLVPLFIVREPPLSIIRLPELTFSEFNVKVPHTRKVPPLRFMPLV